MSGSSPRKLVGLCERHHQKILELLSQLIETENNPINSVTRLLIVRHLRQRLSRHLQLERHSLYPPLRHQAGSDSRVTAQVSRLEQSMAKILPEATSFLHAAERNFNHAYVQEAQALYQKLEAQFDQENQILHALYNQLVPVTIEHRQLKLFRQRLLATVHSEAPAKSSVVANKTIPLDDIEGDLPTAAELDRDAITRPARPGETFWTVEPAGSGGDRSRFQPQPYFLAAT